MNKYFNLKDKDNQEIPHKKGYKARLIEDKINGIGFYVLEKTQETIEKEKLQGELSITNERLIECFEHFLNKITNITNVTDLLKFNDYPYDLSELLKERMEIRNKIKELESEVESDG